MRDLVSPVLFVAVSEIHSVMLCQYGRRYTGWWWWFR